MNPNKIIPPAKVAKILERHRIDWTEHERGTRWTMTYWGRGCQYWTETAMWKIDDGKEGRGLWQMLGYLGAANGSRPVEKARGPKPERPKMLPAVRKPQPWHV